MTMKMLVIFDLDGTLLDTVGYYSGVSVLWIPDTSSRGIL